VTRDRSNRRLDLPCIVAGLVGLGLFAAYVAFELRLPRGPAEFVFWPPLEPLPFAAIRGFTYEQLARHVSRLVLLGPALLALSVAAARCWRISLPSEPALRRLALLVAGASLAVTTWVMAGVLGGRAIFDDELTYKMQAQLLGEGRLAEDTVPPWGGELFTIWTRRGATGKYLFGEPLVQIVGNWLDMPALLHLPLAMLTLGLWYLQVKRDHDPLLAAWATILLAASPMLIITTATGLSHTTSLFCVVLAGIGCQEVMRGRESWGSLVLGTAIGFGVTVRAQTVLPAGVVLGAVAVWTLWRRRRFPGLLLFFASGGVWAVLVAVYDRALTGSALVLPWSLFEPLERYGFGQPLAGDPFVHDLRTAVENLLVVAVRMNGWWLGWPLSLGLLGVWVWLVRSMRGVGVWLAVGAAIVAFHVPYYSTGVSETGPIYFYELLLPLSLLGAQAVVALLDRAPRFGAAFLVVHMVLGTGSFLWEKVSRVEREVEMIHGPVEATLTQVKTPALVIFEPALQESLRLGWLNSGFPKRERAENAPIVHYPRGRPDATAALRRRYSYRHCYYYRIDPQQIRPQLLPCEAAEQLLVRPNELPGPALAIQSTAMRKGLLDPFARRR